MHPLLPDYDGACLSGILPALLGRADGAPAWLPDAAAAAHQVVLLALDGLGWEQLRARPALAPVLSSMAGGPISSVVPSTTATCLTSLTTGAAPGRHGVVGYRVHVGQGAVLNVLRWTTAAGDATGLVPPEAFAPLTPFAGSRPPVITRSEFGGGGFSEAHLRGGRAYGWRVPSTLVTHVNRLLADGEAFVYAYYDGIDKVAHEHGFGPYYDAELRAADRLVGDIVEVLPPGAALLVTSDHGQVAVGADVVPLHRDVMDCVELLSGEGRFRWLHAKPGHERALADATRAHHADRAWVRTRDEVVDEGWLGATSTPDAVARLGDVVVAARDAVAFVDPAHTSEVTLQSRHGSLTAAEMLVPLLVATR